MKINWGWDKISENENEKGAYNMLTFLLICWGILLVVAMWCLAVNTF
jgi:hypothetical protein